MKYTITLEVESDTNPREWTLEERLIIDEPYRVMSVEEVTA